MLLEVVKGATVHVSRRASLMKAGSFDESREHSNAQRPDQPVESGRYTSLRFRLSWQKCNLAHLLEVYRNGENAMQFSCIGYSFPRITGRMGSASGL